MLFYKLHCFCSISLSIKLPYKFRQVPNSPLHGGQGQPLHQAFTVPLQNGIQYLQITGKSPGAFFYEQIMNISCSELQYRQIPAARAIIAMKVTWLRSQEQKTASEGEL